MPVLIAILTFASLALLIAAVVYPMVERRTVNQRLVELMPPEEQRPQLVKQQARWQVWLASVGRRLRIKQDEMFRYGELLVAAGFRKEQLYVFLGSKLLVALFVPAVFLFLFVLPQGKLHDIRSILIMVCLAIGGFILPSFWLGRRVEQRKTEIFHMLPDVLDLLTVSVEAGLNLDAALIKTAENFQHKGNPLIEEIQTVTLEIRAGKPRTEALKGMATRTMVEDIGSFVAMLVQTEKFGTSLGKTLRIYSDSLRMKRKQQAEEAAAKTSIKMLFPLTIFIFPSLLVVMLVPAFFKIIGFLSNHAR
ncbi:type II secretion system F family protein [Geotalea sp. SG265]|uniref:type II secretion system F family protein n=1 Tax=Geotalea sp. SG265 TaxID=2922867 RepID=UPI001FAE817A|nr:type II secretion system F family protein [Geotalea sp. SG265]